MSLIDRFSNMRAGGKKPVLQTKSVTPTASGFDVEPDSGYDGLEKVTVSGDVDLIADNIKKNINIFGVTGTVPTESEILDYYFYRTATNQKYKYNELQKRNPLINTLALTTMEGMFEDSTLETVDFSNFVTTSVTNMSKLCKNSTLSSFQKNSSFNTANVTTFAEMFRNCINLNGIDLSELNTSNITNTSYMFDGCTSITSINLKNWDTSSITDMSYMFNGCSSLSTLNLVGFDFTSVSSSTNMFSGVPSNCAIAVSSQEAKDWILNLRSDFTNIVIFVDKIIGASDANGNPYAIYSSTNNGASFTNLITTDNAVTLCKANTFYYAYGFTKSYYSLDGINWFNTLDNSNNTTGVGKVVYVNSIYACIYNNRYFKYSSDGIHWMYRTINVSGNFSDIFAIGNTIYLTNATTVAYSTDNGVTFTLVNMSTRVSTIIEVNGKFFSLYNGNMYTSTDLINWTQLQIIGTVGTTRNLISGVFVSGFYLFTMYGGGFLYSRDGLSFTHQIGMTPTSTNTMIFNAYVIYTGAMFVGFGFNGNRYYRYTSDDGINWTSYNMQQQIFSALFIPAE